MNIILIALFISCLGISGSKATPAADITDMDSLFHFNDTLTVLSEYADSRQVIELKMKQVENINRYRSQYGVQDVCMDILASRIANKHAAETVKNDYFGHINREGHLPFMRYGIIGGQHHILENLAMNRMHYYYKNRSIMEGDEEKLRAAVGDTLSIMKEALDDFMKEGPGGGHHDNIVMAHHNHVGIGYSDTIVNTGDTLKFRMVYAEEFVDKYISFSKIPSVVSVNSTFMISGEIMDKDAGPAILIAYRFDEPVVQSIDDINRSDNYNDYSDDSVIELWPWDLKEFISGRRFSVPLKFDRPGMYYIQIFLSDPVKDIPYEGGSFSTDNAFPASGIIIFAEE
ncbi:MAG: hypothetical protein R6U31_04755 [bacterium]